MFAYINQGVLSLNVKWHVNDLVLKNYSNQKCFLEYMIMILREEIDMKEELN